MRNLLNIFLRRPWMRLGIIGLGEYATRIHLRAARAAGTVVAVVDLPTRLPHLKDQVPEATLIAATRASKVAAALRRLRVDAAIISTPPQARKDYMLACIGEGIPVLADKPLTMPPDATIDIAAARQIITDYDTIRDAARQQGVLVWLHTQRRFSRELAEMLACARQTPPHHIEMTKVDGQQRSAEEVDTIRQHGYLGEGIIAHSTYHYLDMAALLLSTVRPDELTVTATATRASELLPHVLGGTTTAQGESSVHVRITARLQGRTACTADVSLTHLSVSSRDLTTTPRDWERHSGRIKQETIVMHCGHDTTMRYERIFAPDGLNGRKHVRTRLETYHHPLHHPQTHEVVVLANDDGSLHVNARERDFRAFIDAVRGEDHCRGIISHDLSVRLLAATAESLAREHAGLRNDVHLRMRPLALAHDAVLSATPRTIRS